MAMIRVSPVTVSVRTGWVDGRPREIAWGDDRVPVTRVLAVREETSAYPVAVGPRTTFEVEAGGANLSLSFRHRGRRWTIDALDDAVFDSPLTQRALRLAVRPA